MKNNLDQFVDAYTPAFRYAHDNEMLLSAYANRIEACLAAKPIRRILSLGIGHSIVSNRLLQCLRDGRFKSYQMIEGSKVLIEDFSRKVGPWPSGLEITQTTFEEYSPSELLDGIEMGFVLEHVDDPMALVSRYRKYLAKDGVMFIAVPNARSLHRLIGHAAGMLDDLYALSEWDRQLGHQRYFDLESLKTMVESTGLKTRRVEGLILKPLAMGQLQQLELPEQVWRAFMTVGFDLPAICNGIYLEATH